MSNLDGSNRQTIRQAILGRFFGIAFYQGNIYYTDWRQK